MSSRFERDGFYDAIHQTAFPVRGAFGDSHGELLCGGSQHFWHVGGSFGMVSMRGGRPERGLLDGAAFHAFCEFFELGYGIIVSLQRRSGLHSDHGALSQRDGHVLVVTGQSDVFKSPLKSRCVRVQPRRRCDDEVLVATGLEFEEHKELPFLATFATNSSSFGLLPMSKRSQMNIRAIHEGLRAMASRDRHGGASAHEDEPRCDEREEQQAPALPGPVLPPPPPVDYGVFMQGLVQAMHTQTHTQAALQAQLEAQPSLRTRLVAFDHRTLDEALSAACRQEGEMEQYLEEKKASQKRPAATFQRQDKKKTVYQTPQ
ncbi:hypothetical protein Taro_033699 [Colocasia esculenta]|uniref:Uncharacterized protein n=1 Tax=Colocasia esculenta TaxID=4460 RepID=A0A843W5G4_COLES|nr:hypothetical protein [Colocasia esculenta]